MRVILNFFRRLFHLQTEELHYVATGVEHALNVSVDFLDYRFIAAKIVQRNFLAQALSFPEINELIVYAGVRQPTAARIRRMHSSVVSKIKDLCDNYNLEHP